MNPSQDHRLSVQMMDLASIRDKNIVFKYTRRERREKKRKEVKSTRCILRIVSVFVSYSLNRVFYALLSQYVYLRTYVCNSQLNRETDLTACPAFTSQSKHRVQLCIDLRFKILLALIFHFRYFYARSFSYYAKHKTDTNSYGWRSIVSFPAQSAIFFLILIYDSMYVRDKSKAFFHFFLPNFLLSIVKMYRTPFNIQLAVVLATNSSQYTYMYTYININVVNKSIKLYKKIHEYI